MEEEKKNGYFSVVVYKTFLCVYSYMFPLLVRFVSGNNFFCHFFGSLVSLPRLIILRLWKMAAEIPRNAIFHKNWNCLCLEGGKVTRAVEGISCRTCS
jgi:hypothetical protein